MATGHSNKQSDEYHDNSGPSFPLSSPEHYLCRRAVSMSLRTIWRELGTPS